MTNQLQGEILYKGWSGSTSVDWAYTPWMPVRGDLAVYAVEVLAITGGLTLTWEVETRVGEDPQTPTIVSVTPTQSTTLVGVATVLGNSAAVSDYAKQWVRYKFHTGSGATLTDYVIFRALQPSWQVNR